MKQFPDVLSAIQAVAQLRLARASSTLARAAGQPTSASFARQRTTTLGGAFEKMNALTYATPRLEPIRTALIGAELRAAIAPRLPSLGRGDDVHEYLEAQQQEQRRQQEELAARAVEEAHHRRSALPETPQVAKAFWRILKEKRDDAGGANPLDETTMGGSGRLSARERSCGAESSAGAPPSSSRWSAVMPRCGRLVSKSTEPGSPGREA